MNECDCDFAEAAGEMEYVYIIPFQDPSNFIYIIDSSNALLLFFCQMSK